MLRPQVTQYRAYKMIYRLWRENSTSTERTKVYENNFLNTKAIPEQVTVKVSLSQIKHNPMNAAAKNTTLCPGNMICCSVL